MKELRFFVDAALPEFEIRGYIYTVACNRGNWFVERRHWTDVLNANAVGRGFFFQRFIKPVNHHAQG